ncbi:TPA: class II aldolase/adducin family protein, partial [Klebsiella pneumoniae]
MATEQHLRQQLAAAYRLAALFGNDSNLLIVFYVQ